MTKRMGWWSQVTQLGLSQALQDERCSFKGGVVVWDGLGRASGHRVLLEWKRPLGPWRQRGADQEAIGRAWPEGCCMEGTGPGDS